MHPRLENERTYFTKTGTVPATGLTDVGATPEIVLDGVYTALSFQIETANYGYTDFVILGRVHASADWVVLKTAANIVTAMKLMDGQSAAAIPCLKDVPWSAQISLGKGFQAVKFQVQATTNPAVATIYGYAVK